MASRQDRRCYRRFIRMFVPSFSLFQPFCFFPLLVRTDSIGTAAEEVASEKFSFLAGHAARVSSVPVFVVGQGIQPTWNALFVGVQAAMFP